MTDIEIEFARLRLLAEDEFREKAPLTARFVSTLVGDEFRFEWTIDVGGGKAINSGRRLLWDHIRVLGEPMRAEEICRVTGRCMGEEAQRSLESFAARAVLPEWLEEKAS